jgi:hypothetical protein
MAFCSRCGQQTADDPELCTACSVYAADLSRVGAYSGAESPASYSSADSYDAPRSDQYAPADSDRYSWAGWDRRSPNEQAAWDSDVLPRYERVRPGEHVRLPLAPPPEFARPPDADPAVSWPRQPGQLGPRRRPEPAVHSVADRSLAPTGRTVPSRNGRWIAVAAALTVLLAAAAVAISLLVLHRAGHHSPRADRPRAAARSSSPAPSSAPSPAVQGLVTVDPGAATAQDEAGIAAFLSRYFSAINRHDYGAYEQLFSSAQRAGLSAAMFNAGYGTTRDSAERLHSIGVMGAGQIDALVTFTSHQLAADSPTNSRCTTWSIALYLVKQGHRYLLVAPPQGYQASYHRCS